MFAAPCPALGGFSSGSIIEMKLRKKKKRKEKSANRERRRGPIKEEHLRDAIRVLPFSWRIAMTKTCTNRSTRHQAKSKDKRRAQCSTQGRWKSLRLTTQGGAGAVLVLILRYLDLKSSAGLSIKAINGLNFCFVGITHPHFPWISVFCVLRAR